MCGIASRRKADELIVSGKVKVNGIVVMQVGGRISPGQDRVRIDGKEVALVHEHEYLVFNKPKDAITTLSDERGRRTVMDLVRSQHRVYPIGRLDRNTTGVLLLTSDGEFAHRLMHPKFRIPKSYRVRCDKEVSHAHLGQLRRGIELEDGVTGRSEVLSIPGGRGKEIGITIQEGRNRQVRRMFESLGYMVLALDRIAYGPVTHEGLARGETRRVTPAELRALRRLAGMDFSGEVVPIPLEEKKQPALKWPRKNTTKGRA
jgi:pseudouridine synthase